MNRRFPPAKFVLLPLVAAAGAFWVARDGPAVAAFFEKPTPNLSRPPREPDAGAKVDAIRHDLQGLARRRAIIALSSTPSLSVMERLRAAGIGNSYPSEEVLRACARTDPEGTWRMLLDAPHSLLSQVVLEEWLRQDPQAAILAVELVPWSTRSQVTDMLANLLWSDDPKISAAVAAHLELFAGDVAIPGNLSHPRDWYLQRLLTLPASASREELLLSFARINAADWLETTTWTATLPRELRSKIEARLAQNVLQSEPGDENRDASYLAWAAQWVARDASPEVQQRLGADYVNYLATSNPEAALAWANEHLSGYPLAKAVGSVAAARFASDPDAALEMVADLPTGGLQSQAADQLTALWGKTDPAAALRWWNDFPHGKDGFLEVSHLMSGWAHLHPEQVREFLSAEDTPGLPKTVVMYGMGEMMRKDPAATLDWLATLDGDNRDPALETAFSSWSTNYPEQAAARLVEQPELITAGGASSVLLNFYRRGSDRAPVVSWVTKLPEGEVRSNLSNTLREWISDEPAMPAAQKRALLAKLP